MLRSRVSAYMTPLSSPTMARKTGNAIASNERRRARSASSQISRIPLMPAATGSSSRQPTCRSVPIDNMYGRKPSRPTTIGRCSAASARKREGSAERSTFARASSNETLSCAAGATGTPAEPGPIRSAYGLSALTPWNTTRKANPVSTQGRTSGIRRPPAATNCRTSSAGTAYAENSRFRNATARTAPSASGFSRSVQASSTQKNGSTLPPCASSR